MTDRSRWAFSFGLVALAASAVTPPSPTVARARTRGEEPRTERRALWISQIDSDFFDSPESLRKDLVRIKAMGFNEVAPVAFSFGMPFFVSDSAGTFGPSPYWQSRWNGRDLLHETVDGARALGLRVHPWFETIFDLPYGMDFVRTHPDWFTKTNEGEDSILLHGFRYAPLNPLRPEVQDFVLRAMSEAVTKYALSGLEIDDHFAMDANLGYDDWTLAQYGKPAPRSDAEPGWDEWTRWRSERLSAFARRLSRRLHEVGGATFKFELSTGTHPLYHAHHIQDWENWARNGIIDNLTLQTYTTSLDELRKTEQAPIVTELRRCLPVWFGLLAGLRDLPVSSQLMGQEMALVRKGGFDGFQYFHLGSVLKGTSGEDPSERAAAIRGALMAR